MTAQSTERELETLKAIERRVLWLAVRIIDYANRERPSGDDLKVGGHQASSASMVSLMTALYFSELRAADRVSVKPHASPVLHAIEYLLGRLDPKYLTTLRDFKGLQAYPSRTKDPFPVDYSTGSVGLGAAAPLFGSLAARYVQDHFGLEDGGRFISLIGDAELDEGNVWEAVIEPGTRNLGNVLWIVDLNRQSLDRVVPVLKSAELQRQFEAVGWQVLECKYGRRLRTAFAQDGGVLLRDAVDGMPNQVYQGLFGASDEVVKATLLDTVSGKRSDKLRAVIDGYDGSVGELIQDLGGHDIGDLLDAFAKASAEPERPTVLFAYTVKGYGLPIAGRRMNHSAVLTGDQIDELREANGLGLEDEWSAFAAASAEGQVCAAAAGRLLRPKRAARAAIAVPAEVSTRSVARTSTQAAFGQLLLALSREDGIGQRLVTLSPDVSVSTNLGGWINKLGVWGEPEPRAPEGGEAEGPLTWDVHRGGQHVELGISEMNLFLLLGQLGLTADFHGERLLPVGTVYDPFVARGLDALIYSLYLGSRFMFAGTPSGVSLSREGGAHQSTVTPGLGIELPELTYWEPTFAQETEWIMLDGLQRLQEPDGESQYLRLSTKTIEQAPFTALVEQRGEEAVRADVLCGGFRLRDAGSAEYKVLLAACGSMVPETLAAAELLASEEGVEATVICPSSPDRLYREWRAARLTHMRDLSATRPATQLESLVPPAERGAPLVTVIDGASHSLAFLGAALGVATVPLGVDTFGQTGSQPELYEAYDLSPEAIATAALIALG
jgi:pyruvate dehydrogenase E1 component